MKETTLKSYYVRCLKYYLVGTLFHVDRLQHHLIQTVYEAFPVAFGHRNF